MHRDKRLPSRKYSDQARHQAVAAYLITGSPTKTAEIALMPVATLLSWMKEDWWQDLVELVKAQKRVELSGKLASVVDQSVVVVEDRLVNGDIHVTKQGEVFRIPVGAKVAGDLMAKALDRKLVLDKVNVVDPKENQDSILDRLKSIELRLIEASKIGRSPLPVLEGEIIPTLERS